MRDLLRKHKNLWCDLAFRSEQGAAGKVPAEWRAVFVEFPDRFMVGTDTFTPERWQYVVEHASGSRAWLANLPPALAERIAWRNGEALFAFWQPPRARRAAVIAAHAAGVFAAKLATAACGGLRHTTARRIHPTREWRSHWWARRKRGGMIRLS